MSSLLYFLETRDSLKGSLTANLYFNTIAFYNYQHDIINANLIDKSIPSSFRWFIKHPLIHWNLELVTQNAYFNFDLITNLTSLQGGNNISFITYNGLRFVTNPSMVFDNGEFLNNFSLATNQPPFNVSRSICNLLEFRKIFLNNLIETQSHHGFFIQDKFGGKIGIFKVYNIFKLR